MHAPRGELIEELRRKLEGGARPDVITLAGSGEPTLHLDLEAIVADAKGLAAAPVAVLTNGSLLFDKDVRAACARADMVLPSLDAGDEAAYRQINRPHESLSLTRVVDGLVAFRKEFAGPIWLEVFFVQGLNTDDAEVQKIRALVDRIQPDKVHLNTAVRPTAEAFASRVPEGRMQGMCAALGSAAEVVADYSRVHDAPDFQGQKEDVLGMLQRRPCSLPDIASGLGMHLNQVLKFVTSLKAEGAIREERRGDVLYYVATGE